MRVWQLGAFVLAAAASCGGDEDIDCSFEACGGDPVGSWNIDGACTPATGGFDECPGATIVRSVSYSGTWTFESDMTYRAEGLTLTSLQGSFPVICLGEATSCEDLADQGVSCRTAGDRCECNSVSSDPLARTGSWFASGSMLTLDGEPFTYCRSGGELTMRSTLSAETFVLSN